MSSSKHGTSSAYFNGCKCDHCKRAGAAARRDGNHAAYTNGTSRKLPLFSEGDRTNPFDEEDQRHGTLSAYTMGCRCTWCASAGKLYRSARKQGRKLPRGWNARYPEETQ